MSIAIGTSSLSNLREVDRCVSTKLVGNQEQYCAHQHLPDRSTKEEIRRKKICGGCFT